MTKVDFQMFQECRGAHIHETYSQIMIPLKLQMGVCIGGVIYEVKPEAVIFIPPGLEHQCHHQGLLMVVNIPQELIEHRDAGMLSSPLILERQMQIMKLVQLIQAELEANPESKAVHYLYNYLYSKLVENSTTASVRYITENYDQPITVAELARLENYNPTYFNDWFKQQTGFSPNNYLRCVRISKAKELLDTTAFSVMEIAAMVGYSSNSTLTRAFHEVTGMTPKKYRAAIKLGQTG